MMARIFDVIEYPNEMKEEIVHRFPESGAGDFRLGSQVIVRESQNAVFFRDGKALDVFKAGRHTITTANVPYLIDLIGKAFNDRSPFTAEVYFVSKREFLDRKWGTPQPIVMQTPGIGLGWLLLQGFGTYAYAVTDPQQFVTQVVGTQGTYDTVDIEEDLRSRLLRSFSDLLGEMKGKYTTVQDIISNQEEIGAAVRAKAQDDFEARGLVLKAFIIANLTPSRTTAEALREMGLLDTAAYTQLQAADAMRAAANNPSGGAGLTAGIGAGVGIGQVMGDALRGAAAGKAAASMPDVMTTAEAAAVLKVDEADVLAAIKQKTGGLKAKKVGSSYRITKESLTKYLGG
jgi:excisionase family DNA binding protein